MMAMRQNPNTYAYLYGLDGARSPRLSRAAWAAIGLSVMFHLSLAGYLYAHKVGGSHLIGSISEAPPIQMTTYRMPSPTPEQIAPARPIIVHRAPTAEQADSPAQAPILAPAPQVSDFKAPPSFAQTAQTQATAPPTTAKMIQNPNWLSRPSADQMERFYPQGALDRGVNGEAVLACSVTALGKLTACGVISETPANAGFGQAALKLSAFFAMSPRTENGEAMDGGEVRIPIRFTLAP